MALVVAASLTPVGALANTLEKEVMAAGNRFDFTSKQPKPSVAGGFSARDEASGKAGGLASLLSAPAGARTPLPVPPPPGRDPAKQRGFWSSMRNAARAVAAFTLGAAAGVAGLAAGIVYAGTLVGPLYVAAYGHDVGWNGGGFRRNLLEQLKAPVTFSVFGFQEFRKGMNDWIKGPPRK